MSPEDMSDAIDDLRDDQEEQDQAQRVTAAFDAVFGVGAAAAFQEGYMRRSQEPTEESARSMRAALRAGGLPVPRVTIH